MTVCIGLYTPKGVSLLADRRACINSEVVETRKIFKAGKYHFAIGGFSAAIVPITEALTGLRNIADLRKVLGEKLSESWDMNTTEGCPRSFDVSALITDGTTLWKMPGDLTPNVVHGAFATIGSGGELALGALAAGAGGTQALAVACEYDARCGNGFDRVDVPKRRRA